ncbi:hypothetical protein NSK_005151, partial [Nannochloropsis salina CCMP1776]
MGDGGKQTKSYRECERSTSHSSTLPKGNASEAPAARILARGRQTSQPRALHCYFSPPPCVSFLQRAPEVLLSPGLDPPGRSQSPYGPSAGAYSRQRSLDAGGNGTGGMYASASPRGTSREASRLGDPYPNYIGSGPGPSPYHHQQQQQAHQHVGYMHGSSSPGEGGGEGG